VALVPGLRLSHRVIKLEAKPVQDNYGEEQSLCNIHLPKREILCRTRAASLQNRLKQKVMQFRSNRHSRTNCTPLSHPHSRTEHQEAVQEDTLHSSWRILWTMLGKIMWFMQFHWGTMRNLFPRASEAHSAPGVSACLQTAPSYWKEFLWSQCFH
jgi:hypothetical protein